MLLEGNAENSVGALPQQIHYFEMERPFHLHLLGRDLPLPVGWRIKRRFNSEVVTLGTDAEHPGIITEELNLQPDQVIYFSNSGLSLLPITATISPDEVKEVSRGQYRAVTPQRSVN